MTLQSLTDLLLKELADLNDAENQLIEALPLMAEASFSPELRKLFDEHLDQTRVQVDRLEKVFRHFKIDPRRKHCLAMAGLIKEAQELLSQEEEADPSVLDAALITAAQKVEHYEIAGYGSVRTFARILGITEVQKLLQDTLDEEELTDRKLTAAAEEEINLDAAETDVEIVQEAEKTK
jgi:ferritin-like metal-binding protein YciE